MSGHLHDYGLSVRLEDAETGKVIARVRGERDAQGHVLGVERKRFIFRTKRLRAAHRYRVVGEYENPTGHPIPNGAMAHIVALFLPDNVARWPAIDPRNPDYQLDLAALPERVVFAEAAGLRAAAGAAARSRR
jgi:hypothetical protein